MGYLKDICECGYYTMSTLYQKQRLGDYMYTRFRMKGPLALFLQLAPRTLAPRLLPLCRRVEGSSLRN